jgi:TatA/E family protein of Tat protein translocase
MGPLGWQETVFIFILALLIFGPKKLPELGKTVGKALTEFRRASSELKATFDREMSSIERENESLKEVTQQYQNQINSYDDSSYYDGAYGSESYDSTASNPSTVSAPETQGAESTAGTAKGDSPAVAGEAQTPAAVMVAEAGSTEEEKPASTSAANGKPSACSDATA